MQKGTPPPCRLVSKRTIANALGVGLRTLERWIAAGDFPAADYRLSGQAHRWDWATVEAWLAERAA
ncbi:MAG: helix-turn-helix domain-containing protein [Gammaproteobacteria bacterium]|nr:helix-turn-helix domain-containing protein [Gammaproteobacteria bacterium]